jgi:hypothetical protein
VAAALQIWSPTFSKAFDGLPPGLRENVQRKIGEMVTWLEKFLKWNRWIELLPNIAFSARIPE